MLLCACTCLFFSQVVPIEGLLMVKVKTRKPGGPIVDKTYVVFTYSFYYLIFKCGKYRYCYYMLVCPMYKKYLKIIKTRNNRWLAYCHHGWRILLYCLFFHMYPSGSMVPDFVISVLLNFSVVRWRHVFSQLLYWYHVAIYGHCVDTWVTLVLKTITMCHQCILWWQKESLTENTGVNQGYGRRTWPIAST